MWAKYLERRHQNLLRRMWSYNLVRPILILFGFRETADFPSREQFLEDLTIRFYNGKAPPLPPPYAKQLFNICSLVYHVQFTPELFTSNPRLHRGPVTVAQVTYDFFLSACDVGLTNFAHRLPPIPTEGILSVPLFDQLVFYAENDLVDKETQLGTFSLQKDFLSALYAFAKPFKEPLFADHGFNFDRYCLKPVDTFKLSKVEANRARYEFPWERCMTGTPFYPHAIDLLPKVQVPFEFPQATRFEHHWIVAGTGHGKTNTLEALILDDLTRVVNNKASIVVIDSENQLIPNIAKLKQFARGGPLHNRLVLLDPTDTNFPLALNLFDIGQDKIRSEQDKEALVNYSLELFQFIIGGLLDQAMTPNQATLFDHTILLMLEIPNATIATFVELMQPRGLDKYRQYVDRLDDGVRPFFEHQFDAPGAGGYAQTKQQVSARLFTITRNSTFRRMFSSPKNKLDLGRELNSGKVILVHSAEHFLGERGCKLFGRFFLALIAMATAQRAANPNPMPTFVYLDECYRYIKDDPSIINLLIRARKQQLGVILSHQYLDQVGASVYKALGGNTAIKMAGGLSDADARALAPDMRCKPDFILTQPDYSFATYVHQTPPSRTISLKVPHIQMKEMPHQTPEEQNHILRKMRDAYSSVVRCSFVARSEHVQIPSVHDIDQITIPPLLATNGGHIQYRDFHLLIPAATRNGAQLRVPEKGRSGFHLYLNVTVAELPEPQKTSGKTDEPDEWG
jgi:hypothetical protein